VDILCIKSKAIFRHVRTFTQICEAECKKHYDLEGIGKKCPIASQYVVTDYLIVGRADTADAHWKDNHN
jgi:hypothetical protein